MLACSVRKIALTTLFGWISHTCLLLKVDADTDILRFLFITVLWQTLTIHRHMMDKVFIFNLQ